MNLLINNNQTYHFEDFQLRIRIHSVENLPRLSLDVFQRHEKRLEFLAKHVPYSH